MKSFSMYTSSLRNRFRMTNLCGLQIFCLKLSESYPFDMWKLLQGSKIQITLLIEYLKARTLFEVRITPEARSIMSSLNDSCWSNISMQAHLFEIRITPQARLIMSSLNDSTCNLNYIELQRNLAVATESTNASFNIFSKSAYKYNIHDFI